MNSFLEGMNVLNSLCDKKPWAGFIGCCMWGKGSESERQKRLKDQC